MLMLAELKGCATWFIYFFNLLWVRYNCAKFHHCRTCVTEFREQPPKSPSWTGLKNLYKEFLKLFFNPFIPNAPFLYPLKTSAILTVFRCFQKIEETCIGTNMLALKRSLTLPCGFSKNIFFRERRWRYVFCDF